MAMVCTKQMDIQIVKNIKNGIGNFTWFQFIKH